MKKWEYTQIVCDSSDNINPKIEEAGMEGWELVSVAIQHFSASSDDFYFYFKREKKQ